MGLSRTIAKRLSNYGNSGSVGTRLRAKRIRPLLDMIEAVFRDKGAVQIIDLGGTETYWRIVPRQFLDNHRVTITIVNLPGTLTGENHGPFRFVAADACNLAAFSDRSFDIAHSNSVIEHVGDWTRMTLFAAEVSRVAEHHFVQTPNYWFPVEPHCMTPFFHWLPEPVKVWLVLNFQLGHWPKATSTSDAVRLVQSARLLNRRMFRALFENATISTERLLLLPKSLIAVGSTSGGKGNAILPHLLRH